MSSVIRQLVEAVEERSPGGVAGGVGRLIRGGVLPPGSRLPTVREFANVLGTSPTTVSQAWHLLTRAGLITPQGRRGTFVAELQSPRGVWRVRRTMGSPGRPALDLSTGTPDLALLPDVRRALANLDPGDNTRDYYDAPVIVGLEAQLRSRWPYEAPLMTVVDGAMDALDRIVRDHVYLGSPVLIENPSYPPLLDLLELVGASIVPLELDSEGVTPQSLAAGLTRRPAAVFLQPRAQNPTGTLMSRRRAKQLAKLLAGADTLIVEDDHNGDIASAPVLSLGEWLPESTVYIQSFSKSYGPDLRLAAVSGPAEVISQLVDRRLLGPGWSSRLLQHVLLELMRDPVTQRGIVHARETYSTRRQALLAALGEKGVRATAADGINAWVEVEDEQSALLAMAANGVGVAAGSPFIVAPLTSHRIRVTAGLIRDDVARVAALVAAAAGPVTSAGERRR